MASDSWNQSEAQSRKPIYTDPVWREALFEGCRDAIFISDVSSRFVAVNRAACELTGYTREELLSMGIPDLHREGDLTPYQTEHSRILSGEEKLTEAPLLRSDGTTVDVEFNNRRIVVQGRTYMHTVARDISARRRVEQALRESEQRLNMALDAANGAQWEVNLRYGTSKVSAQYGRMLGYSTNEIPGTPEEFLETVHPEDRKLFENLRGGSLAGTGSPDVGQGSSIEFRLRAKSGEWRWMMGRGKITACESSGEPERLLGIILDITETKRAERERKELEAQVQETQKLEALGALAGGIAHDFNNVLSAIFGFTEMALMQIPENSLAREDLGDVLASAGRARELVHQILTFSRKGSPERELVDLQNLVKEVLALLRATLPSTIEMTCHIEPGSYSILANATEVHQVLMNLCTNASHAMRSGGGVLGIRLGTRELEPSELSFCPELTPGSYFELVVSDTGYGMSPETQARIFEPFFTTKSPGEGTGLGLAVAYGILRGHGGAIKVQSALGEGSKFSVFLPRAAGRPEKKETETKSEMPQGGERILWVDDEQSLVAVAQRIFERQAYRVTAFTDSREALKAFFARPDDFDLVVTDQTMPGLTGLELAKACLEARPALPIILCTGYSDVVTPADALKAGIKEFLMKPIRVHEIAKIVRRVLDEARAGGADPSDLSDRSDS